MDYINKLAELLNVAEITEDWKGSPALEIGPWHTADGYEIHVVTNDAMQLDWENDVYYYEPRFEDIIDRIKGCADDEPGEAIIHISDIDTYLPEYAVRDYIEEHTEDEDE
jgi:hypothetical protein